MNLNSFWYFSRIWKLFWYHSLWKWENEVNRAVAKTQEKAFCFYMLLFQNCRITINLIWHDKRGRSRILEKMGKSWRTKFFTMKFHFEFLGLKTHFFKTLLFWICKHFCDLLFLIPQVFNSSLAIYFIWKSSEFTLTCTSFLYNKGGPKEGKRERERSQH